MISIRAELEKRGRFLTDPGAVQIYERGVLAGGVEATDYVLAEVVKNTPVGETGALWKGWQKSIRQGVPFRAEIINSVPYGESVEKGSRPHVIRPRWKKALAFIPGGGPGRTTWAQRLGGGGTVFAKKVNHPGTKPQRFVEKTVRSVVQSNVWNSLWARVIDKIMGELSK